MGNSVVTLEGEGFALEGLRLTTVWDLDAYIQGTRKRWEQMRHPPEQA